MKYMMLLAIALSGLLFAGCNSVKPLALRHYSRNIIAKKDKTLFVENEQIDFKNLKHELVRRLITTSTPIAVHFHKDLPQSMADTLLNKLRDEGFVNIEVFVFGD